MASSAASARRMAAALAGVNGILTSNRGIVPSGSASPGPVMSAGGCAFGELGFELGDAPVGGAGVGAGGLQALFGGLVVAGGLVEAGLWRGVLTGQALRCLRGHGVVPAAEQAQGEGRGVRL